MTLSGEKSNSGHASAMISSMDIEKRLTELSDESYRKFVANLIPNVDSSSILGVRIPILRKLSKELEGSEDERLFLVKLPHKYLDENNLHAIMISNMKDIDETLKAIESFLPYVDNWMTSDTMNPKSLRKDMRKTNAFAHEYLHGNAVYQRRYAITTFMKLFLDRNSLDTRAMEEISKIEDDDYYVRMAASWYWAEALAKCPETTIAYFEGNRLFPWIRQKAIQKARESYKIDPLMKQKLKEIE